MGAVRRDSFCTEQPARGRAPVLESTDSVGRHRSWLGVGTCLLGSLAAGRLGQCSAALCS